MSDDDPRATPVAASAGAGRRLVRAGTQGTLALALIAGLSLMARPSAMPPAGAEGAVAADAPEHTVAGGAAPAAQPAPEVPPDPEALRLRLDEAEPGDPTRLEPTRAVGIGTVREARETVLARGAITAIEDVALRLTVVQGDAPPPGLFVVLARRAASASGLSVLRTGARDQVETQFGPADTLEVTLGGGGAPRRVCTGFATADAPVRIDGWLCAPLGRPPEPQAVRCALDALTLEAGGDAAARAFFRAAEAHRDPACRGRRLAAGAEATGRTGSIGRRVTRRPPGRARRRTKN